MLRSGEERREAVDIVRRIGYADGEITPESEVMLERIARILKLDEGAPGKAGKGTARSRPAAAAAD